MRNFFKKIDETVREMWLGTFLWGCLCELVSVWWVKDRLYSGLGILIGMLLAMAGIWHMWKVLDTALELGDGAQKYVDVEESSPVCCGFSRVCSPDADTFCRPVSGVCRFDGNESFGLSAAFYTRIQRKEEEVRR